MNPSPTRCLVLACGNTLRSDDGVGPMACGMGRGRFRENSNVRVLAASSGRPISPKRLPPPIRCSSSIPPLNLRPDDDSTCSRCEPAARTQHGLATHHHQRDRASRLSRMSSTAPCSAHAMLFTVGAGSTELGETSAIPSRPRFRARAACSKKLYCGSSPTEVHPTAIPARASKIKRPQLSCGRDQFHCNPAGRI